MPELEKEELLARAMEGFNLMPDGDIIKDLVQMLFNPENITLITEIANPHAIAGIELLQKRALDFGLVKLANTYEVFLQKLHEAFVSKDRKSRDEVVEIAKSTQYQEPETLAEKHEKE